MRPAVSNVDTLSGIAAYANWSASIAQDNGMVRTTTDPAAFRETFVTHMRRVDPDAAISGTGTMLRPLWPGPSAAIHRSMARPAALLIIVVIAAAWLPARRATRIRPTVALQGD